MTQDGKLLLTPGIERREGQICVLDAADRHIVAFIQVLPPESLGDPAYPDIFVRRALLSSDGTQLLVLTSDDVIHVYQITQ